MTCTKCRYEFCWICGHEWNSHSGDGYSCAKAVNYDEKFSKDGTPAETVQKALKASAYLLHYRAHVTSQENEARTRQATIMRFVGLLEANGLRGDAASDFAMRAFAAVDTARSVLIWSYPYAFYLPEGPGLRLFQHLQVQLASYVDELTDVIENKPRTEMQNIELFLSTVEKNTEALLRHVS
jgi:hypothetical protein